MQLYGPVIYLGPHVLFVSSQIKSRLILLTWPLEHVAY